MDFYTRFTDHFRGEKDAIKARLQVYVPLLEPIMARYPQAVIVDLGSGRGEWLELMKEKGWPAKGIDTNESMADACRRNGLSVEVNDALVALQQAESDSLAAVTGFHIAEHLPFDTLVSLVQEVQRALLPGGVLILETPNPENLTVGLWSFHLDPTHQRPLPPPLLHFLALDTGFGKVHVQRLNGPEAPQQDASLRHYLDWVVSAYPDYALIAHKHADDISTSWFDYLQRLEQQQQGSLETLAAGIKRQTEQLELATQQLDEQNRQLQLSAQQLDEQRQLQKREQARHEQAINSLDEKRLLLEQHLYSVVHSRSWRITRPLRHLMDWQRRGILGSGQIMRRLARIAWLKSLVMPLLNRFPALKARVLKGMAQGDKLFSRAGKLHAEDFRNLEADVTADVRREALALRDAPPAGQLTLPEGIRLEGHINGSYSLASVNRHLLTRLQTARNALALWLVPHESDLETGVRATPGGEEETARLNALVDPVGWQALAPPQRVALYHHYPLIEPDPAHGISIALFFWEESRVPDDMVATLNRHYRGVIVTAWFVKKVLMDSGCRLPIHIVSLPLVANDRAVESHADDLSRAVERRDVHLLHVSSAFPRKGVDILLQAFERLAEADPELTLTIKTFPNPHNRIEAWLEEYVSERHRERLHLIMEDCDAQRMAALYRDADIIVLPTRGEGLNMPAIEAGEFSRLLVSTGYGAHTDFVPAHLPGAVEYCFDHARSHFGAGASWVEPSVAGLVDQVQHQIHLLRHDSESAILAAEELHSAVRTRFFAPAAVDSVLAALARLQASAAQARPGPLALSLYTSWQEPCGIAQYSRHLVDALRRVEADMRLDIHAPRPEPQEQTDDACVQRDWQRGRSPGLRDAAGDIIWLQHHFAFYDLDGGLMRRVRQARQHAKRVYITLHTTRPVLDFDSQRRRMVAATLAAFDRVFVHTLDDLNYLKRVGITDNVTRMPQGVEAPEAEPVAVHARPPTIGCFGFLMPHKGVNTLIHAFALLLRRQTLPEGTSLRLVTALRDDQGSQEELARCRHTARQLGVEDHIQWYTDFLPLEAVSRYLAECNLVVLPYQYTQESSSAAVRTAVAACSHLLTTPAPIFDEVSEVVWQTRGFESEDIADGIQRLLNAPESERSARYRARRQWLDQRRWPTLAHIYVNLMKAALVDRRLDASSPSSTG